MWFGRLFSITQQTTSKHSKEDKGMVWKGENSKTMPQVIHTQTITRVKKKKKWSLALMHKSRKLKRNVQGTMRIIPESSSLLLQRIMSSSYLCPNLMTQMNSLSLFLNACWKNHSFRKPLILSFLMHTKK